MKIGVACNLLFGDDCKGSIPYLRKEYLIDDYLEIQPTCPEIDRENFHSFMNYYLPDSLTQPQDSSHLLNDLLEENNLLSPLSNQSIELTESYVEFFSACILFISKHATLAESYRKKRQVTNILQTKEEDNLGNYIYGNDSPLDLGQVSDEENYTPNQPSQQTPRLVPLNKWQMMDQYCSRSFNDPEMTLIEKIWLIIARTDGECGQLLGQAVSRKLDGIRAWVASYILWGAFSVPSSTTPINSNNACLSQLPIDTCLPKNRSNFQKTISELKYVIDQHQQTHPRSSSSSSSPSSSSPLSSNDSIIDKYNELHDNILFVLHSLEIFLIIKGEIKNQKYQKLHLNKSELRINERNEMNPKENQIQKMIGQLISVHCGHNGWPHRDELQKFGTYLSTITWEEENAGMKEKNILEVDSGLLVDE